MEEGPRIERIEAARAQVHEAEAELLKAQWQLDNCIIRAPVSGTILKKNAEEGEPRQSDRHARVLRLCEMADLSDLEVDLTIQGATSARFSRIRSVKSGPRPFPTAFIAGCRGMPTADRAKGAIPVRVKVKVPSEEEGVYLKPEMGGLVSFLKESKLVVRIKLTIPFLCQEASQFAEVESTYPEPTLYGVTDGKAIGTYLEHKFRAHLGGGSMTFARRAIRRRVLTFPIWRWT